jgi:predicted amidophosphoribosyltransferase
MKNCPHCKQSIELEVDVCPKCRKPLKDSVGDEELSEKERQIIEERLRSLGYL